VPQCLREILEGTSFFAFTKENPFLRSDLIVYYYKKKKLNFFFILTKKKKHPEVKIKIFSKGPFLLCLMTALIAIGVVVFFKLSNTGIFVQVFYTLLMIVQIIAYGGAATKNEGIMSSHKFVDEGEHFGNAR
jgi:hypothetical protein